MLFYGDILDVYAISTEVAVAKLFAAAGNFCSKDGVATIELRVLDAFVASSVEWNRREKDALLLCLDRSLSRVYPPLDPLQYTQMPPQFLVREDGFKVARVHVTPSLAYFHFVFEPHRVEGVAPPPEKSQSTKNCRGGVMIDVAEWSKMTCVDGDGSDGAAASARRRWRRAAWMTARFFNEASWRAVAGTTAASSGHVAVGPTTSATSGGCGDVLEAAAAGCHGEKRLLHVDVFGMEITGIIVAMTLRYAYVAVPLLHEKQVEPRWVFITRVGIPSVLAEARAKTEKHLDKSDVADGQWCGFCNEKEVISYDDGPLLRLALHQRTQVTLRAHKVFCKSQTIAYDGLSVPSISFEDVAVMSHRTLRGCDCSLDHLTSFSDILQIVRESCARFLRGYKKYAGTAANSAEEQLFAALTDTVCVRMKRTRSGSRSKSARSPVTIASPQEIPGLVEGTCVEFKANIGKWHDVMDTSASDNKKMGITNLERIRHTMAAMASTLGGVLVVGVTDDGEVIGHARDVLKGLRFSGFCPAMAKGSITVAEMRAIAGDRPATMPKDWWKRKTPQEGEEHKRQDDVGATDCVVTVVTMSRGHAPFYATSRHSVPYMRGFASTLPMHVIICARRIANILAQ